MTPGCIIHCSEDQSIIIVPGIIDIKEKEGRKREVDHFCFHTYKSLSENLSGPDSLRFEIGI